MGGRRDTGLPDGGDGGRDGEGGGRDGEGTGPCELVCGGLRARVRRVKMRCGRLLVLCGCG